MKMSPIFNLLDAWNIRYPNFIFELVSHLSLSRFKKRQSHDVNASLVGYFPREQQIELSVGAFSTGWLTFKVDIFIFLCLLLACLFYDKTSTQHLCTRSTISRFFCQCTPFSMAGSFSHSVQHPRCSLPSLAASSSLTFRCLLLYPLMETGPVLRVGETALYCLKLVRGFINRSSADQI